MKVLIQMFTLLFLISCGGNQAADKKIDGANHQYQEEFKPDSSYVEYWCSIDVLKNTDENIDELDLRIVAEFLASFHKSCLDDVEFSEWSNELLFVVLDDKPNMLLDILSKNDSLDKDLIMEELENPISNEFNLAAIIKRIEISKSPQKMMKKEIIESLKVAIKRLN